LLFRVKPNFFPKKKKNRDDSSAVANDYDGMSYKFDFVAKDKKLYTSFVFDTWQEVTDICGDKWLKDHFQDITVCPTPKEDYNVTFEIDLAKVQKVPQLSRNMTPEQREETLAKRAAIKKSNDEFLSSVSDKISKTKRHFLATPFEFAMQKAMADRKKQITPISFGYRADEKIWIMSAEKEPLVIYIALNFKEETDSEIARILFNDLKGAREHSSDAPSISYFSKFDDMPPGFKKAFPLAQYSIKDTTYVISIMLFEKHISGNCLENTATMLQGFRQYVHYHIHANKCYLHGKIREKSSRALRQVNLAKYEIEGVKLFKGRKGKGNVVDMAEDDAAGKDIILRDAKG
jgi:actin related protein 2/3 complex subunit 2